MYEELGREIATRRRVYPTWIKQGRITWDEATRRVSVLHTLMRIVKRKLDGEDEPPTSQRTLFDEADQ